MAENKIYKILLIEPSEIVASGMSAIINRSSEFKLTTILPNLGYHTNSNNSFDIVIINPAVIDYNERYDIRSIFYSEDNKTTIVALTYTSHDENVLRQYDGCIGIYDSADRIFQKLHNAIKESKENKSELYELSTRERDILVAVAKGKTNKEIADEFNISIYTVISHRRNISRKLGISSISGLTVYAIMNKLIDISSIQ
ncbi:MAG: response regulator transcription factor [Bacteroidales bacterium]|nr:response regulator transcription factor [Bacteroidales bacterium]MBR2607769.1 response regulator transcription factor [Bacteroidaceae bacterium]